MPVPWIISATDCGFSQSVRWSMTFSRALLLTSVSSSASGAGAAAASGGTDLAGASAAAVSVTIVSPLRIPLRRGQQTNKGRRKPGKGNVDLANYDRWRRLQPL